MSAVSLAARNIAFRLSDPTVPLRARIAELEEENAYLRSELGQHTDTHRLVAIRSRWPGFTPSHAAIVAALYGARGQFLTKPQIDDVMPHSDHVADRDLKCVDVRICQIRKMMGASTIETIWGKGYRLSDAGALLVHAALEGAA